MRLSWDTRRRCAIGTRTASRAPDTQSQSESGGKSDDRSVRTPGADSDVAA